MHIKPVSGLQCRLVGGAGGGGELVGLCELGAYVLTTLKTHARSCSITTPCGFPPSAQ